MKHPLDLAPCVIIQNNKKKSLRLAEAVLAGDVIARNQSNVKRSDVSAHGVIFYAPKPEDVPETHLPVFIGMHETLTPALWAFKRAGRNFLILDNGYLDPYPHGPYFRATFNGMQAIWNGEYGEPQKMLPWRQSAPTDPIVICLQTERWFSFMGMEREAWLNRVVESLRRSTSRPTIIREKPGAVSTEELAEVIGEAHAVVALSSRCLLQGAMLGVSAFPQGLSATSPLNNSHLASIDYPYFSPERHNVFAFLRRNQWTIEEIASGKMNSDLYCRPVPAHQSLA